MYSHRDRARVSSAALDEIVDTVSLITGKKLKGIPILADPRITDHVRVLTCPPCMHICMHVVKSILDAMLEYCVPPDTAGRARFSRFVEGAAGINARGKISASVSTFRRLIAQ